ncbi:hypothetical protein Trydic_g6275 [Trypoxylus dichotomus]
MVVARSSVFRTFGFILWIVASRTDSQEECGHPIGSFSTGKIVGGYDVGYYKYPWYVALIRDDVPYCGGTLIAKKFVVTAAHCFQPFLKAVDNGHMTLEEVFQPRFGVYNICRHENTQKQFGVAKVYVHEKYRKHDPYFDIALMKLKQDAKGFQPCCLLDRALDSRTRPKEGYVSGLGDQQWNAKSMTCTMHEARILIYPDDVCKKMLDSQGEQGKLLNHAFCAGYMEGGIDACQGDSGGPLIIAHPSGHYNLLGITSFGFECAKPDTLGLYTDVTHYLDWIRGKMGDNPPSTPPTIKATTTRSTSAPSIVMPPEEGDGDYTYIEGTTSVPSQGSTTNWSVYPVTPWEPVAITPFPHDPQDLPARPQRPVMIVINILKKHKMAKSAKRRSQDKEDGRANRFHHKKRML